MKGAERNMVGLCVLTFLPPEGYSSELVDSPVGQPRKLLLPEPTHGASKAPAAATNAPVKLATRQPHASCAAPRMQRVPSISLWVATGATFRDGQCVPGPPRRRRRQKRMPQSEVLQRQCWLATGKACIFPAQQLADRQTTR
eukprot:TRINITY_DN5579_c0_g1_i1.p2 TRINITY_DN5579_c0_g1~~TRINITY_DN5579_c0_g1_i1.p2  ORF type:complete len:142 (+),score=31.48 TRINITY_DN5579_c0_g1_i1:80-505(+)